MSTVIGLFQHDEEVQNSLAKLQQAGFTANNISILTSENEVQKLLENPRNHTVGSRCALCGALLGFGLFGLVSLIRIGCQCFAISVGFEFYIFTFVFLTTLGTLMGAFFGGIVGAGEVERDTQLYTRGVCCGYPVMAVQAGGELVAKVIALLREEKAVGVKLIQEEVKS